MFDKSVLNLYSAIIGLFFIISGAGKALDTSAFSYLIYQYGFEYFTVLSPVIAIVEILLGLYLLLNINVKRNSLYAFILLIIFTVSFGYAHFFHGINDCGCFGTLIHVNISPVYSFIRNFVLLSMSLIVWIKYPSVGFTKSILKKRLVLSVMCISIFIAGYTFNLPGYLKFNRQSHDFQDSSIKDTELSKYIDTTPDRKYLVFCFSYTCPHCWNSIENLRQFIHNKNIVDSVLVLATGEEKDRLSFEKSFKPDFEIRNIPDEEMGKLTDSYPTAFYTVNDTVKVVIKTVLPSPVTFSKQINNSKSN
ncbi:MAG: hypothetical protein IAE90_11240 [Ignavibacteria bacterium]|nr:hypothetical protein [Ignavibacteria bacterium]